jgi:hypothetical protein
VTGELSAGVACCAQCGAHKKVHDQSRTYPKYSAYNVNKTKYKGQEIHFFSFG